MSSMNQVGRKATEHVRVKPETKIAVQLALAQLRKETRGKGRVTEDDVVRRAIEIAFPDEWKEAMVAVHEQDEEEST